MLDDLVQRQHELSRLFGRDNPGKRLLDQLGGPKAKELKDRVVRLQDLPFQVRDEKRVRRIGDDDVGSQGDGCST
jgi:hypothetical protein